MKIEEFERLELLNKEKPIIDGDALLCKRDRTLLFGYTCDRRTYHVYIKDIKIHVITYRVNYIDSIDFPKAVDIKEIEITDNQDYIPDKRLYPEACDYEFCRKLQSIGFILPFTAWNDTRQDSQYYGAILE